MDTLRYRLRAGGFDRRQPIGQHGGQDGDHLTIAIIGAGELASHALQRRRQHPVLEGRTVAQRARLASQDRHVMPWIVNRLASAIAAAMLCDDAPAPQPGRLLIARDTLEIAGETVVNALRPTLDKLAALIRMPEPVIVADEPPTRWMDYFRVLQAAEAWACHGEWIAREKPALGPGVKERFAWAPTVRLEDIARATARREEIARRLAELLEGPTVLAVPSAPGIAVPRNSPPEVLDDLRVRALALLCIAGLARLPQISLPLVTLDGCPLGLSLIAARGNDTLLLELAARLK